MALSVYYAKSLMRHSTDIIPHDEYRENISKISPNEDGRGFCVKPAKAPRSLSNVLRVVGN